MIFTEEQLMIRDSAREFARRIIAPNAAAWEAAHAVPRDVLREMAQMGLMTIPIPAAWGGAGADYIAYSLALTEIAAGDGAISTVMSGQNSVVAMPLLDYGTDEQRQRYLRPLSTGAMLGAFALTEPQSGSDASDIRTTAVRDGNGWRIDGTKQFITTASIADFIIVFAITERSAGKKGISAFIVETSTPGFRVTRIANKMGQNASDTCAGEFDGAKVGADAILGHEGEGYKIALSNLEGGRIGIASQCIGMARASLDIAVAYAKERRTFGKPIAAHQGVAFRLAEMATSLKAAEQLVLHAAELKAAERPCLVEASMAKLFASEMVERVCSDAIQTLGGNGYMVSYDVERIFRAARGPKIYEGTNDIQRLVISRGMTGY